MFSIYSDRSFLASRSTPHAVILSPFWGTNPETPADTGRFDDYAAVGSSFLRLSSLAECDVAVFPQNWESADARADELGGRFVSLCHDARKTPVIFHCADTTEPPPVDAVFFRTSLIRSQRGRHDFAFPAWSVDFLVHYFDGEFRPRPRRPRPVVGFCGHRVTEGRPGTVRGRLRSYLDPQPGMRQGLAGDHPRTAALRELKLDKRLRANFTLRGTFWGSLGDSSALMKARREYARNMLESDYVLCVRGGGNFSYRLYETLSMGRIPIFVDTDCVLPLDFEIDWRKYCVWVDESEIDRIGDRVLEFHESLDDAEFEERQQACRRLWETHISPQGFFAFFHRHFEAR